MKYVPIALAAMTMATSAPAAVTVISFDALEDYTFIGNAYAAQGIEFSDDALAVRNIAGGGLSEFENPPSPFAIATFTGDFFNVARSYINVVGGFDTGFAFYYSADKVQTVTIYDGLNGTGNALGSITLAAQYDQGCTPGVFCNWTAAGAKFAGVARSVDFTLFNSASGAAGFDDITFGSAFAPGVPEPQSWALMLLGFGLAGTALRRQRRLAFT